MFGMDCACSLANCPICVRIGTKLGPTPSQLFACQRPTEMYRMSCGATKLRARSCNVPIPCRHTNQNQRQRVYEGVVHSMPTAAFPLPLLLLLRSWLWHSTICCVSNAQLSTQRETARHSTEPQ